MRVSLFVTCLVDQFWPSVGRATLEVLRRAGCEVTFDPAQTCCGQPAFNTGYRREACQVVRPLLERLVADAPEAVVVPSGSCAAMLRHLPALFPPGDPHHEAAASVASKTHELSAFLVRVLEKEDLGARFRGRVTWHDACHGLRELGIHDEPRRLIDKVQGATLVEMDAAEACCGFGGTFSVKYPEISIAILDRKLEAMESTDVQAVVSGDVSCLMQIGGRLSRRGSSLRTLHLSELLASRDEEICAETDAMRRD